MAEVRGMPDEEMQMSRRLIKLERECRRLRERYEISLELADRETELRKAAEKERREKEIELDQVVGAIAKAIDAKDEDTNGHSVRVAGYSRMIAAGMGLGRKMIEHIYQAALLHDVGKVGVPDAVLKKPGRLTGGEFDIIRKHTLMGGEILGAIKSVPYIAEGALYHHERWDGRGYPQGLSGEAIPLTGRIIAIADVYDAMQSRRCYKEGMSRRQALAEIRQGAGTQFDPEIVEVFCQCISSACGGAEDGFV
ncbi:HD-GYP domain-containing protein [Anaerovibrio sp.]|uniref:HD-GYP domain-containing protein n=1 Tax=Anaerovibrio sp. TaxID=1872532 RepID=UPI003F15B28A